MKRTRTRTRMRSVCFLLILLMLLPTLISCVEEERNNSADDDEPKSSSTKKASGGFLDDIIDELYPLDTGDGYLSAPDSSSSEVGGSSDTTDNSSSNLESSSDKVQDTSRPNDTTTDTPTVPSITFDGADYYVLSAGNKAYNDFEYQSTESTVLGRAQYQRIKDIDLLFKVKIITNIKQDMNSNGSGAGFKAVSMSYIAGDPTYNIAIIGDYDVAALAYSCYLEDINSVPYVDVENDWWDQDANTAFTIDGLLFFTNGPLTAAHSDVTSVIYMNRDLAKEKLPGTDLYQLVKSGKWTVDKFGEYVKRVSDDINGDGVMDQNDRYGLYVWQDSIVGMLGAANTKTATVGTDGKLSLTLYNNNSLSMFNKFTEIAYNKNHSLMYQKYTSAQLGGGVLNCFEDDRALFWITNSANTKALSDMDMSLGILPYPKLSESQNKYYSTILPSSAQFICVPMIQDSFDMTGVITEALAYLGKTMVWPAYYEQSIVGAFAKDGGVADMLDIIYGSYNYDIGAYYKVGDYNSAIMQLIRSESANFSATYQMNMVRAEVEIDTINANYQNVINEFR